MIGQLIQPYGKSLPVKTTFYRLRFNHQKAFMSDRVLGWQALIIFLGTPMWININKDWIVKGRKG
jgi:hypothetical protein